MIYDFYHKNKTSEGKIKLILRKEEEEVAAACIRKEKNVAPPPFILRKN